MDIASNEPQPSLTAFPDTCESRRPIPYGRQSIREADIEAVCAALRSDYLTTGPLVDQFERAVACYVGAQRAVALSSGTAALHAAVATLDLQPGDEVIVPAITFVATANAVVYCGGTPIFADVDPDTLLIDIQSVADRLSPRTRAVIGVDYAGQPVHYAALHAALGGRPITIIADACHSLGANLLGRPVGTLADLTTFSFHPVKCITTCEGGMVVTADADVAARMRRFRSHGIDSDHRTREQRGVTRYDMVELGFNYRLSDVQCALGIAQLTRIDDLLSRRRLIAARYDAGFASSSTLVPLKRQPGVTHAQHLYVVRLADHLPTLLRGELFTRLRELGVAANVHYPPVHLHAFHRQHSGGRPGLCPHAERLAERIISLPIYPDLTDEQIDYVIRACQEASRDLDC